MMPSPFRKVVCQRCERLVEVAGAVDADWQCDDCLDHAAQAAVEAEAAWYYGGSGGKSEQDRRDYAKDTGRRR